MSSFASRKQRQGNFRGAKNDFYFSHVPKRTMEGAPAAAWSPRRLSYQRRRRASGGSILGPVRSGTLPPTPPVHRHGEAMSTNLVRVSSLSIGPPIASVPPPAPGGFPVAGQRAEQRRGTSRYPLAAGPGGMQSRDSAICWRNPTAAAPRQLGRCDFSDFSETWQKRTLCGKPLQRFATPKGP
jgi:hypothetical protein